MTISRREFLGAGAAAAATVTLTRPLSAATFMRVVEREPPSASAVAGRPVVVASANGIRGVAKAYDLITRDNADTSRGTDTLIEEMQRKSGVPK